VTLLSRQRETAAIERVLEAAARGVGGALVVRGPPGMGKTALLDHTARRADGMTLIRIKGREAEMDFAFAGVVDLVGLLGGNLDGPLVGHRETMELALGAGEEDLLPLTLSVLTALATIGVAKPVLCIVDDAHLLDESSAKVLGFIARRVQPYPVAIIFAADEGPDGHPYEGLPELSLAPLADADARVLLGRASSAELDDDVRDELVRVMGGNPLALIELTWELSPAQLAGHSPLPQPLPVGERIRQHFLRRARRLPRETQILLLLIAAEPSGEADVIGRAARRLELGRHVFRSAREAGIVDGDRTLSFRSSFFRTALYEAASAKERRDAHGALAAVTDSQRQPERHAWHRAAATESTEADPVIADELERAATVARARGAYASAVSLLERSVQLTPDREDAVRRTIDAAEAALLSEDPARAGSLLDRLAWAEWQGARRGLVLRIRGRIDNVLARDQDTAGLLFGAARDLEQVDTRRSRDAYLDALMTAVNTGTLLKGTTVREAAHIAARAPTVDEADRTVSDLLLEGFTALYTDGSAAAAPLLREALGALRDEREGRLLVLGCHAAVELFEDEALYRLVTRRVELANATGSAETLAAALNYHGAVYRVLVGQFNSAAKDLQRSRRLAAGAGNTGLASRAGLGELILAAWRGHEADARALAEETTADAVARGQGAELGFAQYALAVLDNGLGNARGAFEAACEACEQRASFVMMLAHPELIEAASRTGEPHVAENATAELAKSAAASRTELAAGLLARSRACIAKNRDAEDLYRQSIVHLKQSRARPQLARSRLLYGEWLRRERRRRDAREQLRRAHEIFAAIGAEAFARRAQQELVATGGSASAGLPDSLEALTPHERRIALLVAEGASNPEIAERLFVSVRTVEYHMHKIFRKLGIGSRLELTRLALRDDKP
jgi:DNA-binding CsgD family transcriptional regulator